MENRPTAEQFLTEKSDWFDKSPGGEKLYFESEVIRMMNDYANESLRIHAVMGRSEMLKAFSDYVQTRIWEDGNKDLSEFVDDFLSL